MGNDRISDILIEGLTHTSGVLNLSLSYLLINVSDISGEKSRVLNLSLSYLLINSQSRFSRRLENSLVAIFTRFIIN